MAIVQVDLEKETALIPDGDYVVTITKADIKIPEGVNDKGDAKSPYINFQFYFPDLQKSIFSIVSFKAPHQMKKIADAADVHYGTEGFDTNDFLGKQVGVQIGMKDDPTYGPQNTVIKVFKA